VVPTLTFERLSSMSEKFISTQSGGVAKCATSPGMCAGTRMS
jgi:hypothetical protein